MTESYISVGKLGKPHGIRGAFRFLLHRELRTKTKMPLHFMLLHKGSYLPFFITESEWTGFNEGIILFEEISTPEKAKQYSGSQLWLDEKTVNRLFKKTGDDLSFLVGWLATDEAGEEIGTIETIEENPGQVLATLNCNGRQVYIPLADDFILNTDKRKKQISLALPEGLLDL